jgi:ABC-2 type transport system ATP-binding protein
VVATDTPENMKKMATSQMTQVIVEFREVILPERLLSIPGVLKFESITSHKWRIFGSAEELRAEIFRFAVNNGLTLLTLHEQESSIEKIFLELVK